MLLFKALKTARLWLKATAAADRGDDGAVVRHLHAMEAILPLMPHHLALLGQGYVGIERSDLAREAFTRAQEKSAGKRNSYEAYVNGYAEVLILIIDTQDLGAVEDLVARTNKIACSKSIKRALPLSKTIES